MPVGNQEPSVFGAVPAVHPIGESGTVVAALFVERGGVYWNIDDVDPWDEARDARLYNGPHWGGSPTTQPRLVKGADGGCFAAALRAVRRCGGVLEHPADSHAWPAFGLLAPPRSGGWISADWMTGHSGWTCCIEQGAYGHRARKATWLYAVGVELPSLKWGAADGDFLPFEDSFHSAEERRRAVKTGICQRLSHHERAATPVEFRDLLLSIARSAMRPSAKERAA